VNRISPYPEKGIWARSISKVNQFFNIRQLAIVQQENLTEIRPRLSYAAVTTTKRFRFDGRSTAYQKSLRSQWCNPLSAVALNYLLCPILIRRGHNALMAVVCLSVCLSVPCLTLSREWTGLASWKLEEGSIMTGVTCDPI